MLDATLDVKRTMKWCNGFHVPNTVPLVFLVVTTGTAVSRTFASLQLQCAPLGLALAENWQATGRQLADNWQTSSFTTFNCLLRFNRRDLDKARLLEQLWLLILFVSGIELCKFEGSFQGILPSDLHLLSRCIRRGRGERFISTGL